jgi:ATP-dependent Clp protease ATP-binding subunit ClpB
MNLNKYTQKAQEAVINGQTIAQEYNHSQIEPTHLLAALLRQDEGVVPQIVKRLGVDLGVLVDRVEETLQRMSRVSGGAQPGLSRELSNIVRQAEREAENMKDEYVSTEHLFLALVDAASNVRGIAFLREMGIERNDVLRALTGIRGSQRITSQNPEATYEALQRYGRDLTNLARMGKLDPVIGRDEEIRRVTQVLSRRTKNNPVLIGEAGVGKTAIVEGLANELSTATCQRA